MTYRQLYNVCVCVCMYVSACMCMHVCVYVYVRIEVDVCIWNTKLVFLSNIKPTLDALVCKVIIHQIHTTVRIECLVCATRRDAWIHVDMRGYT